MHKIGVRTRCGAGQPASRGFSIVNVVIVSGPLANKPFNGGAAWTRLSYVLGLRKLGFDVYFIEQIAPEACVDEFGTQVDFESSINLCFFKI